MVFAIKEDEARLLVDTFNGEGKNTREVITFEDLNVLDVSKGIVLADLSIPPTMQFQMRTTDVDMQDDMLILSGMENMICIKVIKDGCAHTDQ